MERGRVTKRKADQERFLLTEDTVDDIKQRMSVSLSKFVRKFAVKTDTHVI